jgi:hypothetical protein
MRTDFQLVHRRLGKDLAKDFYPLPVRQFLASTFKSQAETALRAKMSIFAAR